MLTLLACFLGGVVSTVGALAALGRASKRASQNSRVPTDESVVAVLTKD